MTDYFGYPASGADPTGLTFGTGALSVKNDGYTTGYTCPGSGLQRVVSLRGWLKSGGLNTGHGRFALYNAAKVLLAQGSAEILINSTTAQWWTHASFVDVAGNPVVPILTGGVTYYLGLSVDSADVANGFIAGAAGDNLAAAGTDYTGGFPDPWSIATGSVNRRCVQCGVEPEGSNTPSNTISNTISATPSNTISQTVSATPSNTISATPSNTISSTPSRTESRTESSTPSNTISGTPSMTVSSTISNTVSSTPSMTVSATPSNTMSSTPSATTPLAIGVSPIISADGIHSRIFGRMIING